MIGIGPDRVKRALKPHEVTRLLDVWRDDRSIQGLRNNSMIRLLVYTGLRRSELVALRWSDVDIEAGVVTVRHGKGDKERVVAILDSTDGTRLVAGAPAGIAAGATPLPIRIHHPGPWHQVAGRRANFR